MTGIIDKAARRTIGKTTFKEGKKAKQSKTIKEMQEQKRNIKKQAQQEEKGPKKDELIEEYKSIQENIRIQIIKETTEIIEEKFEKMIADKSRKSFWDLKRKANQDPAHESLIVKNKDGIRQYTPESIQETMAQYYEDLFKNKPYEYHEFHEKIRENMIVFSENREFDDLPYNEIPTKQEIKEIIMQKQNGCQFSYVLHYKSTCMHY